MMHSLNTVIAAALLWGLLLPGVKSYDVRSLSSTTISTSSYNGTAHHNSTAIPSSTLTTSVGVSLTLSQDHSTTALVTPPTQGTPSPAVQDPSPAETPSSKETPSSVIQSSSSSVVETFSVQETPSPVAQDSSSTAETPSTQETPAVVQDSSSSAVETPSSQETPTPGDQNDSNSSVETPSPQDASSVGEDPTPTTTLEVPPSTDTPITNTTAFFYANSTTSTFQTLAATGAALNSSASYNNPSVTADDAKVTASAGFHHRHNSTFPTGKYANGTASFTRYITANRTTSQSSHATPPPLNLSPAIPPSIDPHDPVVLQPNRTVNLYFQAPPTSNKTDIPMASIDIPKMAYPAVVLDHSALIADMECDLRKLRMKFLHRDALDVAESSWTMPKFVMMAFHEKCGRASQTGERDYLLVNGLKFDHKNLEVAADIKHIDITEAVGKENPITMDMGTYTPNSLNGTVGFNSQAGTVARNGTVVNNTISSDFDSGLDDKIGYTAISTSQNIKRFTGLDPSKHLVLRSWCGFCDKVINTVKKVVNTFIPSWTLTPLNKNIDVALGGGNVYTPFKGKKGYSLYSTGSGSNYIRLYCVDCGISGVLNVKATVTFNLLGIISGGSFTASGNLRAGLGLGVDASYAASIPAFRQSIASIPLTPFAIPGLISIGPSLNFAVGANAWINARGNLYAGAALVWPNVYAQMNLFGAPSVSGFMPSVYHDSSAQGQVTMGASVYAQVSIGFGVVILNGLKSFGVALVDQPELWVGGQTTNSQCAGLYVSAGFKNTLYADVFGSHYNIQVWNGPSANSCWRYRKRRQDYKALPAPISKRGDAKQIKTADGTIGLHYADNGNVYALPYTNTSTVDKSTIFFSSTAEGILTGDVESRIFHGYSDTLSDLGVSRFRLSRTDHIPKTAVAVTLQQSKSPENPGILIAVDGAHNVLYPVVCTFNGDFPKVFLTKNPDTGATTLTSDKVVSTITGLKADACAFIPFVSV